MEHEAVVQLATDPEATQMGVLVGQAEPPTNAPFTQAFRLPLSAHWDKVAPQALPSAAQLRRPLLPTHSAEFGLHGRHLPATQAGAVFGQVWTVLLNAPLTHVLRLPAFEH